MMRDTAITYEEELKKNPELKESDIQMLREWCSKEPHLPKIPDVQLALFLHRNYFRIEPTKNNIDMYYTVRTHMSEYFTNRDPLGSKELRLAHKNILWVHLKKLTDEGYTIVYAELLDYDPSHYTYNDCMRFMNMISDLWLHKEGTRPGYAIVLNPHGLSLGHVGLVNPMELKKVLHYIQEALPVRLKTIHVINISPVIDIIFEMMKPFMNKELVDMIHFHSTAETLEKFIPLDALPSSQGGEGGNVEDLAAATAKILENNREWFQIEEETMRVNESLRPGKPKTSADLYGVEGSFKNLDID